ncbi:MAG: ABC transporter ATP-binding protein [Acidobacteriota bacterium]|nr:ABC transporter ATP-binding protein [Acidobacteriota bacterium]
MALRISNLTKRFGAFRAVSDLTLEIEKGQFAALFGPNGAGKTTLLKLVAGLLKPTSGTISLRFNGSGAGRRNVGYVSHQSLLYQEMSGMENLLFYSRLYGVARPRERSRRVLERMGLAGAGEQLVREYSRGMKQRLTLGRALLHEPTLLLLDEPYVGLDQQGNRLLTSILRSLRDGTHTVLLVTHNLAEGLELCDRVLIQHRGSLVYDRSSDGLGRREVEAAYLGAVEGEGTASRSGSRE